MQDVLEVSKTPFSMTRFNLFLRPDSICFYDQIHALAYAMVDLKGGVLTSEEPECISIVVLEVSAYLHERLDDL